MKKLFNVGDTIYGFCNGFFGSSNYDDKICVMVNDKYAVFQYIDGEREGKAIVLNNPEELDEETITAWKVKSEY